MDEIVDTHCHIHEAQFELTGDDPTRARWLRANKGDPDAMIADAAQAGVTRLICVGTDVDDSALAVDFVQSRDGCWASIGIHPHEAKLFAGNQTELERFTKLATQPKVVAIGECGLDFYYNHSPKDVQITVLRWQIELALKHDLPLIFHIRDAFGDFWPIYDEYAQKHGAKLRGVVHSFSATKRELDAILQRNLYVGINGIATFTKDPEQLAAYQAVPPERMLLETDAPFLTPSPYRGTICEPKHAATTLSFVAELQSTPKSSLDGSLDGDPAVSTSSESASTPQPLLNIGTGKRGSPTDGRSLRAQIAAQTTANARRLFNLA